MTTEPNEAALKLAREIAEKTVPDGFFSVGSMTLAFRELAEKSALAAILETTERAVKFNERHAWEWSVGTMNASLHDGEHLT